MVSICWTLLLQIVRYLRMSQSAFKIDPPSAANFDLSACSAKQAASERALGVAL
jgi:hypothetical protein